MDALAIEEDAISTAELVVDRRPVAPGQEDSAFQLARIREEHRQRERRAIISVVWV